jgi:hypothetical protein
MRTEGPSFESTSSTAKLEVENDVLPEAVDTKRQFLLVHSICRPAPLDLLTFAMLLVDPFKTFPLTVFGILSTNTAPPLSVLYFAAMP